MSHLHRSIVVLFGLGLIVLVVLSFLPKNDEDRRKVPITMGDDKLVMWDLSEPPEMHKYLIALNGKKILRHSGAYCFVVTERDLHLKFGPNPPISLDDLPILVWFCTDEDLVTPDEKFTHVHRCRDGEIIWKSKIHNK